MYEKLKKLMAERGLTISRAAKNIGISETSFNNWRREINKPSHESLVKLANYFNVPVMYFAEPAPDDALPKAEIAVDGQRIVSVTIGGHELQDVTDFSCHYNSEGVISLMLTMAVSDISIRTSADDRPKERTGTDWDSAIKNMSSLMKQCFGMEEPCTASER